MKFDPVWKQLLQARFGKLHRAAYRIINDINNLQETRKKAVVDKIVGNIIKTLVCSFAMDDVSLLIIFRAKHWVKLFVCFVITSRSSKRWSCAFPIDSTDWIFNAYRTTSPMKIEVGHVKRNFTSPLVGNEQKLGMAHVID